MKTSSFAELFRVFWNYDLCIPEKRYNRARYGPGLDKPSWKVYSGENSGGFFSVRILFDRFSGTRGSCPPDPQRKNRITLPVRPQPGAGSRDLFKNMADQPFLCLVDVLEQRGLVHTHLLCKFAGVYLPGMIEISAPV